MTSREGPCSADLNAASPGLTRRSLLARAVVLGGALNLGFSLRLEDEAHAAEALSEVTAWVVIHPDDSVTIRIARSEMGQGVLTALAMLVAEELECDWAKVRPEYASPHASFARKRAWGSMATGASRSIRESQETLRRAGAIAREMLVGAAAETWHVPHEECRAKSGIVTHVPTGRTARFGELAPRAAKVMPPVAIALKDPREWRLIGRPQRQFGNESIVRGGETYGIDVEAPGLLYAAIAQCPALGGRLESLDPSPAYTRAGVRRVIELPGAVVVVAESWWEAKTALESLRPVWTHGDAGAFSTEGIEDALRARLESRDAEAALDRGDVEQACRSASKVVGAGFSVPFLPHLTMEPQTCTAHVRSDVVEVWAPTQDPELSLATAAAAAGVTRDRVILHRMRLGGGFGRRGVTQDYVRQAVDIARQFTAPVKLIWSREEDIQHDFYRPAAMARQEAALDGDGHLLSWTIRIATPSIMGSLAGDLMTGVLDRQLLLGLLEDSPYLVPNYRVELSVCETPVPVGMWRGISHTQNAFFRECFLDEIAHAAGADPLSFRQQLLTRRPRTLAVLGAAAERAGWRAGPPQGRARGIALHEEAGSICAQVVDVSLGADRALRVHRVVSALDCGHVVDPLTVERQTEGGIAFALGAALHGGMTFADGRVEQSNFHDCRVLRMAEMPEVETVLVPGIGWGGVGEIPVLPLAPALCNAVFAASGQRVRALPLKPA